jgi:hypothetical protein
MDKHYTVTVYVAAPGTPLDKPGETSAAGHVYYAVDDGAEVRSYGFAPSKHGAMSGPGEVTHEDVKNYKDPYYSRTMEVSKAQYDQLREFGEDPAKYHFDKQYSGSRNSCIDFTWGALNHAGLHRKNFAGMEQKAFEGDIRPLENVDDIKSIRAPFPESPLNSEHQNKMPARTPLQRLITEQERGSGAHDLEGDLPLQSQKAFREPLLSQAEDAVRRLEKGLGRDYDANSACLAASAACLAKENGISRIDHVALSRDTGSVRQGENLFVVQGALNDPAQLRAHMRTDDALAKPVEQSLAQLQTLNDTQRQQPALQVAPPEQAIAPQPRVI